MCIPNQSLDAPARPMGFAIRLARCLRVDICDRWPLDGGLADDAMAIGHGEPKRALPLQFLEPREATLLSIFIEPRNRKLAGWSCEAKGKTGRWSRRYGERPLGVRDCWQHALHRMHRMS